MTIKQWFAQRQAALQKSSQAGPFIVNAKTSKRLDILLNQYDKDTRVQLVDKLFDQLAPLSVNFFSKDLTKSDKESIVVACYNYNVFPETKTNVDSNIEGKTYQKMVELAAQESLDNITGFLSTLSESDLTKAVHEKDWGRIQRSHLSEGKLHVDHTNHLEKHPAPKQFTDMLSNGKTFKSHKDINNGISAKMIHKIPRSGVPGDESTFMSKPYHKKIESATKSWVKHPITGWSTMATKALFNAGNIGHLAEDVSTHEHEGHPLTVHQFALNHKDVKDIGQRERYNFHPDDVRQIAVMDFLANNIDRHAGNLTVGDDIDHNGHNKLLAIDHERSFQYHKPLSKHRRHSVGEPDTDESPRSYMKASALSEAWKRTDAAKYNEYDHTGIAEWWQGHSHKIKDEMENQLNHLKDPDLKHHIRTNFMERANIMDGWAKDINENGDPNTEDKLGEARVPGMGVKQMFAPRFNAKALREKMPNNPTQAVGILIDTINKKDKMTAKQRIHLGNMMQEVLSSASPEQLVDLYKHSMSNPFMQTDKVKNTLNTLSHITEHLAEPVKWNNGEPVWRKDHIKAFADFATTLPDNDQGKTVKWRARSLMSLLGDNNGN